MAIPRPCAVTALCISLLHLMSLTVQVAWKPHAIRQEPISSTTRSGESRIVQIQLLGNILRLGVDITAAVLAFTVSTDCKLYPLENLVAKSPQLMLCSHPIQRFLPRLASGNRATRGELECYRARPLY